MMSVIVKSAELDRHQAVNHLPEPVGNVVVSGAAADNAVAVLIC